MADVSKLAFEVHSVDGDAEEKPDRMEYLLKCAGAMGRLASALEITDTVGSVTIKYRIEFP